jgi:hypothetical protein
VKALIEHSVPLTVTKESAAIRQTDAAIDAFLRGDYDVCITLAGAAEGIFSNRKGSDLHTFAMSDPRANQIGQKTANTALNFERDWLKHSTLDAPEQITITSFDAALMLIRCMTKLANWSPKMDQIKPILMSVVERQQIDDIPDL